MWPLYALLSAFFETAKDVVGKSASNKTNEYVTAFSLQFFGAIILIPVLFWYGIPSINPRFWFVLFGFCFTIPLAAILYMRAVKLSPLSVSVPILAVNPIFTALNAVLFDNKFPTFQGWSGIILICIGLYLFRLEKSLLHKGILYPFVRLRTEPGAVAMLGVAFIWSIGAHLSKASVAYSSPLFAGWAGMAVGSVVLFMIFHKKIIEQYSSIRTHFLALAALGIIDVLSILSMYTALSSGLTAYVIALKRTNILWSSVYGMLVLKEHFEIAKLFGLVSLLSGIVLLLIHV